MKIRKTVTIAAILITAGVTFTGTESFAQTPVQMDTTAKAMRAPTNRQVVNCPANISAAATNAPAPWLASGVSMHVIGTELSGQPLPIRQMICNYEGSGSKWYIGRPIQPEFQDCKVASPSSFLCTK